MSIEKKLTYLNETKNQIKSALNTPYNVFRDYPALISKYVKNQPKSIVEGSTAICENAVDLPCNIDVNGNSYQETTEGYQLVDLSNLQETTQFGATVKPNGDGSFTINGTTSNSFGFNVPCTPRNLKANTTYKIKTIVKSGSASSTANSQIALREEADANLINCKLAGESKTYTPTEDKTINYVRIYLDKEVTFTNLVIQAMFYEGTDDKPYEPYTGGQASPNTEYKQDIEVITECSLVQRGKNLINVPEFTITGGTIAYQGKSLVFPQVKKAGTYTLQRKFEIISGLENQVSGTGLAQIYIGTKWLKNINKTEDSATFNIDHDLSSAEQFKITFLVSGSVTSESDITIKYHEIQLEEGDKATSYEPYIEPIVHSIDLQGNSLAKVGEIADLLNIGVDGRVSIGNKK